ncbi:group III truncated hemoglobin [Rhizobium tumorigenes]|uniref:Group III truncated hemoglobin n=1 Tax=Rhizobium tumorigenes TaxID=2041385 RepID=A0AAF1KFX9_9HYPH|nr:group III truncated hemoglobin [Rhizobium tumorigenes]WFR95418.1 group III truncated hemoglobin [Rhizobium tumorigenes]
MTNELQGRAAQIAAMRERAEADMLRIGIDMAFIDQLVEEFYQRIQVHPRLGPVFEARLSGRWPEHMEKMKRFWSSIALKTGAYGGKPVQAHASVEGLVPEMFPEWLGLFAATLADIAPTPEARDWFMTTAERIAKSMFLALFYSPANDAPAGPPPA